jgi:hypothetical protein
VHAGPFTVFGPKEFERQRGYDDSIAIDFVAPKQRDDYQLHIESKNVASATIHINGNKVFAPSAFNNNVKSLFKKIALQKNNRLTVDLKSKPGSSISISIIGIDNLAPTIVTNISPPANDSGWHNEDATITFECKDEFSGISSCSSPVVVSQEAKNIEVSGQAVDVAGNSSETTVSIHLDKTSPAINLSAPTITNTPQIRLEGAVEDANDIVFLSLNGDTIYYEADNSFSELLSLDEGENTIEVIAKDIAGNIGSSKVTVVLDTIPPNVPNRQSITLTDANNNEYELIGTPSSVEPNATVKIFNTDAGTTYFRDSQDDGSFTALIEANPGDNIEITVIDRASNESESLTIKIPRIGNLFLEIANPINNSNVNKPFVDVLGSFEGPEGVAVSVNGKAAYIDEDEFFVNSVPLMSGSNTLTAIATAPNGETFTSEIEINFDRANLANIFVIAKHDDGYAPLESQFYFIAKPGIRPYRIMADYDNDGRFDDFRYYNKNSPLRHTFAVGRHTVKFRIIDVDNNFYEIFHNIIVVDPSHVDRLLRNSFQSMKEALIAGDIESAITYFAEYRQRKFRQLFGSLGDNLSEIAASSGELKLDFISGSYAQYILLKNINGELVGSPVIFTKNHDGVWRIEDM